MLGYYDIETDVLVKPPIFDSSFYDKYDATIFVGLFGRRHKLTLALGTLENAFVYIVGSDAYLLKDDIFKKLFLRNSRLIYVTEELSELLNIEGSIIPIPIDTNHFIQVENVERDKDVLYYNPGKEIYRPKWIENYIKNHPNEKITILDGSISYEKMPEIYSQHKKLIRMTTHDGLPKMPYEALLCGCEVWYNGEKITEIPINMKMEHSIPKLIKLLKYGS